MQQPTPNVYAETEIEDVIQGLSLQKKVRLCRYSSMD